MTAAATAPWADLGGGVHVRRSRAFRMNSVLLLDSDHAVVVDPGVLPSELDDLAAVTAAATPRQTTLFFTHAHWDHVLGRPWFPRAHTLAHDRFASELARDAAATRAEAGRTAERHGERWTRGFDPFRIDQAVSGLHFAKLDRWRLVFRDAPGHCGSSLTLHVPEHRLLVAGDLLSDVEIPGLNAPPSVYRTTIEGLVPLAEGGAIETLVPGHGSVARGRDAVRERLRADLDYLARLERGVATARRAGASLEETQRRLADLPIVGRDDPEYPTGPVHLENVRLAFRAAASRPGSRARSRSPVTDTGS
jgi:glyoxylase-like metal-dependent hydrolase (beta-lactamase superfamily II)